jgi:hypothetical protein
MKKLALSCAFVLGTFSIVWGVNEYYSHGSFPSPSSPATSASMRAEFDLISSGFDKLPVLTGNGGKLIQINGGGTALSVMPGGSLSLGGNLVFSGAYNTTFVQQQTTTLTLPSTNGTLVTAQGVETLSNKALNLSNSTLTGTTAQFNNSLSDGDFATLGGIETLTSKLIQFPALQNSSSNANTLDDYEEGSWTPSVGGTATYTTQNGHYVKVGRLVCLNGLLTINTIGTGNPNTISGIPFSPTYDVAIPISRTANLSTSVTSISGVIFGGFLSVALYSRTAASTSDAQNSVLGNGSSFSLSGCYSTAT